MGLMHIACMKPGSPQHEPWSSLDAFLEDVRAEMADELSHTTLGKLISDFSSLLGTGKMLRSRMAFRVGPTSGIPRDQLVRACAAVEMVHAASLLHDDVIDGGMVRRGAPAFWIERGISGAILLGDLLLFKALDITGRIRADGGWTRMLVKCTGEVCEAESEQELVLRGAESTWNNCVRIARGKTGALFAFIAYALAGDDPALQKVLLESGYSVGTAYQLADDVLDATGTEQDSGKTLGTDQARKKTTAVSALAGRDIDPAARIEAYCQSSLDALKPWPEIHQAWETYLDRDIRPTVAQFVPSPVDQAPAV